MAMSGDKTGKFNERDGRKPGILGPHDIGGYEEEYRTIDRSEKGFHLWEMQVCPLHPDHPWFSMRLILQYIKFLHPQTHSILVLLVQQGLLTTDELRRGVEALPGHAHMSYYHRFEHVLIPQIIDVLLPRVCSGL